MKEVLGFVALLLVSTLTVVGSVFTTQYYVSKEGCKGYAETLNFAHKYTATAGCILKTEQGWIGKKEYIIVKEEK